MSGRRVLVVTPDFPPARGGIQVLTHRVVSAWQRLEPVVVAMPHPDAVVYDAQQPFTILRARSHRGPRALNVAALNATALRAWRTCDPVAVLSFHIVASPVSAFVSRFGPMPYVQYVYAKELGAKPDLAHFALTRADTTVVISEYTWNLSLAVGAPESRLRRINPGVDLPEWREPHPDRERPTILTTARLEDRYKGHDVILRALALIRSSVPAVRWVVIGEGPLRTVLEARARMLGVADAVEFVGAVDDAERDSWMERASVFCMVSRLPAGGYAGEGFGIVYLEANARGVPVVAGGVGGATDAVVDGETGVLVDPEDHVALADVLSGLLRDPEHAARLGRAGRERAERFAWPRVGRAVEDLLLELIA